MVSTLRERQRTKQTAQKENGGGERRKQGTKDILGLFLYEPRG